jgi:hypothetical protein
MDKLLLKALYGTIIDEWGSIDTWELGALDRGLTKVELNRVGFALREYETVKQEYESLTGDPLPKPPLSQPASPAPRQGQ